MRITKRNDNETIATITYYGVKFIGIFERLNNTINGHPRYKVRVIKDDWLNNNYETWCYCYNVVQVYERLKDVLENIIIKEGLR